MSDLDSDTRLSLAARYFATMQPLRSRNYAFMHIKLMYVLRLTEADFIMSRLYCTACIIYAQVITLY